MRIDELEKLKKSLPKVPGIMGRDEYFNSVVLVPLVIVEGEYHLLFEKRSQNIRQGGEVCFPGGMFDREEDKDVVATALRETYEELGIDPGRISIIGSLDTMIAPMGAIVEAVLGVMSSDSMDDIRCNPDEVEYVFSVPVSYFEDNKPEIYHARIMNHPAYTAEDGREVVLFPSKELGLPDMYSKPWGGRNYKIYVYRHENEVIWGITARFIHDIADKLKKT